jgi:Protein of unknown function (Hypoth_ymh)
MTSVDIAEVEAALGKVRAFIALLEQNHAQRDAAGSGVVVGGSSAASGQKVTTAQIQEQLPLIKRITARADADLASKMEVRHDAYSWSYYSIQEASQQLAGLLSSLEEAEQILGPRGPKLSAASLHPWIWHAAVSLWDNGYHREAVQAGATALFDQHLPAKLEVPGPSSAKDRVGQAFSTDPPSPGKADPPWPGKPRLLLDDYPEPSPNWTSQHVGAKFFGMRCAQLIRNLATHTGAQPDEQSALEQLAALSGLARLIDRAKVVH